MFKSLSIEECLSVNMSTLKHYGERQSNQERERDAHIDYHKEFWALGDTLPKKYNYCALTLRGSVSLCFVAFDSNCLKVPSHYALLRSFVLCLSTCYCWMKSHFASLPANNNWQKKICFKSLNLQVYCPTKSTSLKYY